MELLNSLQEEVLKQKEEEAVNTFSSVSGIRQFIITARPAPDVTVTLKICCLSAERINGGRGVRVTGVDASQRSVFEPTADALADLTPLKRKLYIVNVTVWDAKTKKGSYGKTNLEFRPGAVYTFHNVDCVGFYADIATGVVHFDRDNTEKIVEDAPPLKNRKVTREAPKKGGKSKMTAAAAEKLWEDEPDVEMENKTDGAYVAATTRSKSSEQL
ncbi:hypothetical protein PR002_g21784 [Phytophthora rubi]|uniref:Uncharacterized protein n=1 Tax=Phytophthora rubi TaxID=129364 RepID=A0A6A3J4R4_9STRA|nr:hypothetical protein PR002_g21784 [Phytophthora rubi]